MIRHSPRKVLWNFYSSEISGTHGAVLPRQERAQFLVKIFKKIQLTLAKYRFKSQTTHLGRLHSLTWAYVHYVQRHEYAQIDRNDGRFERFFHRKFDSIYGRILTANGHIFTDLSVRKSIYISSFSLNVITIEKKCNNITLNVTINTPDSKKEKPNSNRPSNNCERKTQHSQLECHPGSRRPPLPVQGITAPENRANLPRRLTRSWPASPSSSEMKISGEVSALQPGGVMIGSKVVRARAVARARERFMGPVTRTLNNQGFVLGCCLYRG